MQHNFIPNDGIRLYLRREYDNRISGLLQRKENGTMGYFAGLDNLLLYLQRLCSGDMNYGEKAQNRILEYRDRDRRILTAPLDTKDFKPIELRVTGTNDDSLQGELCTAGESPGKTYIFGSELELLRILGRMV